jgi:LuxR family maltose regulon positive regulatory protein
MARLSQAEGDVEGALAALDEFDDLRHTFRLHDSPSKIAAQRADLLARSGDAAAAEVVVESIREAFDEWAPSASDGETIAYFSALLVLGRMEEVLVLTARLLSEAEAEERWELVIRLLLLRARALEELSRPERALVTLRRALELAEPAGYIRSFVEQGETMARLLYRAISRNITPEYSGRVLAAFPEEDGQKDKADLPAGSERLVEPLSEREIDVLELIAEGQTNREIARSLSIALGTVKTHTYNLYGKLGVNSRTQAVAKAQRLGILPAP